MSLAPEVFQSKLQERLADLPKVKVIRDGFLGVGCGDTWSKCDSLTWASQINKPEAKQEQSQASTIWSEIHGPRDFKGWIETRSRKGLCYQEHAQAYI